MSNVLYVEFGRSVNLEINARVHALDRAVRSADLPWLLESVPSYSTLAILFDGSIATPLEVEEAVRRLSEAAGTGNPGDTGREFELAVRYGGEDGIDLPVVARHAGLTEDEVVATHTSRTYTCYMLGFTPGFVYLGDVDNRIAAPRRATPRTRIDEGSVGIAGEQTGFYGVPCPGGWQIIGRLVEKTFDLSKDPPSMIQPGDRIRFKKAA